MHVDLYEKIWMWAAAGLIVLYVGAIVLTAGTQAVNPPSHLETIDPTTLASNAEFATGRAVARSDGTVVVSVVTTMFAFGPDPIEVPANTPVTFRITSGDVVHGFQVVGTNANAMALPGYVSQFTTSFARRGEYIVACHEYCGLLHHAMVGKLIVK
jgi:cytochrome c oxidase subunit II